MSTDAKSCRTTSANMSSTNPRRDLHRNAAIRGVILRVPIPIGSRRTSAGSICNHVRLSGDPTISGSMQARARPANSPCQTVICLVHCFPYRFLAAPFPLPQPLFLTEKASEIAQFLCNLTPLESALIQVLILINLKFFRMNTYEKQGGGGIPLASAPSHPVPRHSNPLPEESRCVLTP
jgi:hypothetical protein